MYVLYLVCSEVWSLQAGWQQLPVACHSDGMLAVGGGAKPQIAPFVHIVLFVTSGVGSSPLREGGQPGVALLPGPEVTGQKGVALGPS